MALDITHRNTSDIFFVHLTDNNLQNERILVRQKLRNMHCCKHDILFEKSILIKMFFFSVSHNCLPLTHTHPFFLSLPLKPTVTSNTRCMIQKSRLKMKNSCNFSLNTACIQNCWVITVFSSFSRECKDEVFFYQIQTLVLCSLFNVFITASWKDI